MATAALVQSPSDLGVVSGAVDALSTAKAYAGPLSPPSGVSTEPPDGPLVANLYSEEPYAVVPHVRNLWEPRGGNNPGRPGEGCLWPIEKNDSLFI